MTIPRLALTRAKILAYRRHVGALDTRLAAGEPGLRQAAWAGLQDSMPRAALLSMHARVERTKSSTWEDPSLVQLWGPRFSAFVVPAVDRGVFTLGRLPDDARGRRSAVDLADRLEAYLDGRRMTYSEAARGLGLPPNALRYAAPTGRVLLRWDGARPPTIWTVPTPELDPAEARLELTRRFLHVYGPTTPDAFAAWAGIPPARARAAFDALAGSLLAVGTPVGDAWILGADEPGVRDAPDEPAGARLLPSGDAYFLLQGFDRALLVPEADRRGALWTARVWPGALLVDGELVGTWRRTKETVTVAPWLDLRSDEREVVEAEAASLPLPGVAGPIRVRWGALS